MRPVSDHFEHPIEELARNAAREAPEVPKQLPSRVSIRQRSVRIRVAQTERPGQVRQAMAGGHRQHDPRQVQGVEQFIARSALALDQEG